MEKRLLHIDVKALIEKNKLSIEDRFIAGRYSVQVPTETSNTLAASVALDCFHEHLAIDVLDDFEIRVWDENTKEILTEDGSEEAYQHGHQGIFLGKS